MTLSDRFFADVARLGQRHATDPEFFLTVWCAESGLLPTAINAKGGARGLNQMMPDTLKSLGAPADFEKLAGEEQLPWIEQLISTREALNGGPFQSAARYYHSNFFPKTMSRGNSPNTVVVARDADDGVERNAYVSNSGLDVDKDGAITLRDLTVFLARIRSTRCQDSFDRLARAVAALPAPGATWTSRRRSKSGVVVGIAFAVGVASLALWSTR